MMQSATIAAVAEPGLDDVGGVDTGRHIDVEPRQLAERENALLAVQR
jgi:hypothetical protein